MPRDVGNLRGATPVNRSKPTPLDRTFELPRVLTGENREPLPLTIVCAIIHGAGSVPDDAPDVAGDIAARTAIETASPEALHAQRDGARVTMLFAEAQHGLRAAETLLGAMPFGDRIQARVAVHHGMVRHVGKDIDGDGADFAWLMLAKAHPGWVLVSRSLYDRVPIEWQMKLDSLDYVQLMRKFRPAEMFRLAPSDDFMRARTAMDWRPYDGLRLSTRNGDASMLMDEQTVTIGRREGNDILVDDMCASFDHARIEFVDGEYIFIDESTNGTYLAVNGEQPYKVPGRTKLRRPGTLWIGRPPRDQKAFAIDFEFEGVV